LRTHSTEQSSKRTNFLCKDNHVRTLALTVILTPVEPNLVKTRRNFVNLHGQLSFPTKKFVDVENQSDDGRTVCHHLSSVQYRPPCLNSIHTLSFINAIHSAQILCTVDYWLHSRLRRLRLGISCTDAKRCYVFDVFLPRDAMLGWCMLCLFVCLSHVGRISVKRPLTKLLVT